MKFLPLLSRFLKHRPIRPGIATTADLFKPADRIFQKAVWSLLAISALCWFSFWCDAHHVNAGSTSSIRADGNLDFINPEGRVLVSIEIEIADTPKARAIGLMGRKGLDDSVGMLFVHEPAGLKSFWMRNTPTPLDIIFVSAKGRVVHIAANTKPMSDTVYASKTPVPYVVEVLSGFCARYGVGKGTRVSWQRK